MKTDLLKAIRKAITLVEDKRDGIFVLTNHGEKALIYNEKDALTLYYKAIDEEVQSLKRGDRFSKYTQIR